MGLGSKLKKMGKKIDPKKIGGTFVDKGGLISPGYATGKITHKEHRDIFKRSETTRDVAPAVGGGIASAFLGPEAGSLTSAVIQADVSSTERDILEDQEVPVIPGPPTIDDATRAAEARRRQRQRRGRASALLTGPQGAGLPQTATRTLTGV